MLATTKRFCASVNLIQSNPYLEVSYNFLFFLSYFDGNWTHHKYDLPSCFSYLQSVLLTPLLEQIRPAEEQRKKRSNGWMIRRPSPNYSHPSPLHHHSARLLLLLSCAFILMCCCSVWIRNTERGRRALGQTKDFILRLRE